MIYTMRDIKEIRDLLLPGDVLVSCFAPRQTAGTDLGLCKGLTFQGGLYANCKRPDGCTGWDTVMSAQYRTETTEAIPIYVDGVLVGEEPATETQIVLGPSWEAIK